MTEVVSVRFKSRGKLYYFSPQDTKVMDGDSVVVETANGNELGVCAIGNHFVVDERIIPPLRPVIRVATGADLRLAEMNKSREKDAFEICRQKIEAHKLDMKLVDVEYNFEGSKIIFFFASEGRVDFRELVKDLASVFRTRIELRQIGVRDEAKMLGGLGICGREFCCHKFLDEFAPVSTKMAKTQSMSLNPAKISGNCGRLMCCLRYEQEAYEELVKNMPKNGAFVQTIDGYGNVINVDLLRQSVKVKLDGQEQTIKLFTSKEIAVVPGGRPKPGEAYPDVLERVEVENSDENETENTHTGTQNQENRASQEQGNSARSEKNQGENRIFKPRPKQPRQNKPKSAVGVALRQPNQDKKPTITQPNKPNNSFKKFKQSKPEGDAQGEKTPKKFDNRRNFNRKPKPPSNKDG